MRVWEQMNCITNYEGETHGSRDEESLPFVPYSQHRRQRNSLCPPLPGGTVNKAMMTCIYSHANRFREKHKGTVGQTEQQRRFRLQCLMRLAA